MRIINKNDITNCTQIGMPLITIHVYKSTGFNIKTNNKMKPLKKYIHTLEFYNEMEYQKYITELIPAQNEQKR